MPDGELILYKTEDGLARVQLRAAEGTVWLTQADIAELFATTNRTSACTCATSLTRASWIRSQLSRDP